MNIGTTQLIIGVFIAFVLEALKALTGKTFSARTGGYIRLSGLLLAGVATILTKLGEGTLDVSSIAQFGDLLRDVINQFAVAVGAYYGVLKDSRLNFGGSSQ